LLLPLSAAAQGSPGVDVTVPLVEQALAFARTHAIPPPSEAALLRAGAIRVCGERLSAPGCDAPGLEAPDASADGPKAAMAWRRVIESALAAGVIAEGDAFDRAAFQRYVVDGMIAAIGDPSSYYVTPATYRKLVSIPPEFSGFGLTAAPEQDCLRVTAVHPGSPAADAGLRGQERIVAVNGAPVTGYHRPAALAAIWGAEGERIELVFVRGSQPARKVRLAYRPWRFVPFEVERRDGITYAIIRSFAPGTAQAIGHQLTGAEGIVLDLRSASGGQEDEMVGLADMLIGAGSIGSKTMRDPLGCRAWAAEEGSAGERLDLKVAVVVGPGTSGLAEVLASALRDHGRAILLGRQTRGRSTLETIRTFADGSAIQLTTTRLRGPDDTALEQGVLPHVATDRSGVGDLAVRVLELASEPTVGALLAAARTALGERDSR